MISKYFRRIDPGKDDDLCFGVKPEKQPKSSPNLGSPPVPERSAHDVALSILLAIGITWYGFEYQPRQGIEKFDVGVRLKPLWVGGYTVQNHVPQSVRGLETKKPNLVSWAKLLILLVAWGGIEPQTQGFSILVN